LYCASILSYFVNSLSQNASLSPICIQNPLSLSVSQLMIKCKTKGERRYRRTKTNNTQYFEGPYLKLSEIV
jgi:hypothetical protein